MELNRRRVFALGAGAALAASTGTAAAHAKPAHAEPGLPGFQHNHTQVNGVRLHYVTGGRGEPLVLLPGWPQTWWLYHKIMPALAERFRVIAVDLRGMGGSDKPAGGFDKKTMATDIHELVRKLGYRKVNVVGHDLGSMVAFAFAANFPEATKKVAFMDVLHPDESFYHIPLLPPPGVFSVWWFAFNQVMGLPEQLLAGRFRYLADWLFANTAFTPSAIDERSRSIYARAYDSPEAIRASNGWYQAFHQDIADGKTYAKLTPPVLGLASVSSYDQFLGTLPAVANQFEVVPVDGSGHWLAEERPDVVTSEIIRFFG
ncbi:Pimeloyl-ACP methyl ester carboxylesterase [Lentzea fradiae]|uniref:Pimeloyl-ACP methyl ester carboxylesterase n=2 Tax=Lentzea fradiae TaxID=200378 RepID=A0A1G7VGV2_9PSEU|nr:Pimeloyl-ACP methyl ester carboxylesterase [Lentzea fradiae]